VGWGFRQQGWSTRRPATETGINDDSNGDRSTSHRRQRPVFESGRRISKRLCS